MTMRRVICSAGAIVLASVTLVSVQAQRQGGTTVPGNLVTGVWGADAMPVDSRGWGWMTQSYVSANHKRPSSFTKDRLRMSSARGVTVSKVATRQSFRNSARGSMDSTRR